MGDLLLLDELCGDQEVLSIDITEHTHLPLTNLFGFGILSLTILEALDLTAHSGQLIGLLLGVFLGDREVPFLGRVVFVQLSQEVAGSLPLFIAFSLNIIVQSIIEVDCLICRGERHALQFSFILQGVAIVSQASISLFAHVDLDARLEPVDNGFGLVLASRLYLKSVFLGPFIAFLQGLSVLLGYLFDQFVIHLSPIQILVEIVVLGAGIPLGLLLRVHVKHFVLGFLGCKFSIWDRPLRTLIRELQMNSWPPTFFFFLAAFLLGCAFVAPDGCS